MSRLRDFPTAAFCYTRCITVPALQGKRQVMHSSPIRVAQRVLIVALCLSFSAVATGNNDRVALDRDLGELKRELLQREATFEQQRLQLRYPAYARTNIYIDRRVEGYVLERIRVQVNDDVVLDEAVSVAEARALGGGAMQRAARVALAAGEHDLNVTITGRILERRGDGTVVTERIRTRFTKGPEALDIILPITGKAGETDRVDLRTVTTLSRPSGMADSGNAPRARNRIVAAGSVDDPRLGHARYLSNVGRNFTALVELRQIDSGSGDFPLPESYYWLLGESYLDFGMHDAARDTYRRLQRITADSDRLTSNLIRLAEFEYQRGYLFEAVQRLRDLRNDVQANHLIRWQDITSRVLLEQGRYREAADVLQETSDRSQHTLFMRYNLGIALLNAGELVEGRSVLDELSRQRLDDDVLRALRDQANVALGYHFLRERLGGTAKPMFGRVRTEGPFSNRALLGMGWAELAPEGERQNRRNLDLDLNDPQYRDVASLGVLIRPGFFEADIYRRLANRPFRRSGISEDEQESLLRALTVWSELAQRDPMDAAVQEGMLAIPYALDRLGDYEQALERYLLAVETFEEARGRIDRGIQSVEGALMLQTIVRRDADAESGYNWQLLDLPDLPETYWLNDLLAEHRFQEQLKNFRDARQLVERVAGVRASVEPTLAEIGGLPPPPAETALAATSSIFDRTDLPALRLRTDRSLRVAETAKAPDVPSISIGLREAGQPARFDGPLEQFARTVDDFDALESQLNALANRQSEAVRAIATDELRKQRDILDKFLLEARFAVARIYDRRLRDQSTGDAP